MVALEALDVEHLCALGHGEVHGLTRLCPQGLEQWQGVVAELTSRCDQLAELVQADAEPPPACGGHSLDITLGGERGDDPVGTALGDPEAPPELGDSELGFPGEALEQVEGCRQGLNATGRRHDAGWIPPPAVTGEPPHHRTGSYRSTSSDRPAR